MADIILNQQNGSFDFTAEIKNLPGKPGVYIMKNSGGDIIYVGKAINLKNRVKQYFQSNQNHSPKVRAMASRIASFEYIVTDSEYEALILECNLIKKNRPKYNILLKDDKHYPYIKVTIQEEYPKVLSARRITADGAKYYGPYLNTHSIYDTIHELRKVFPIKNCKKELPRDIGKERPCLNYHIGLCPGPCSGEVTPAEYSASIRDICMFLEGKHENIVKKLEEDMREAAEDMRFEYAGKVRDRLFALRHIQEKHKVLSAADYDQDAIAYYTDNIDTCVSIFFIRGGKLIGREQFLFEGSGENDAAVLLTEFVKQFYVRSGFVPAEILLHRPIDDHELIEDMLRKMKGGKVELHVPVRGEKRSLIQFVKKNAEIELSNKREAILAEDGRIQAGLAALGEVLGLEPASADDGAEAEAPCARIEAYDISNYGADDKVASMIVFEEGRPNKNAYRRFRIRGVEGQDDYACMKEVLSRRLRSLVDNRERFRARPDVILVDGGKGHVGAAASVLDEMDLAIPLAGMAKNDRHETSELITDEGEAIILSEHPELYRLISSIQDEAHRFAIAYSKKLSEKRLSMSALDEIRGVGKKRKMALLAHFKTFRNIRAAGVEDIMRVPGIDAKTANAIHEHFNETAADSISAE